jgi:DNA topoisomerase-1
MRTDSVRVSPDAFNEAREFIRTTHGAKFLPDKPNVFKSRKDAQEAHEAIRPTSLELSPDKVKKHLTDEQFKLYKLIWDRFIASQMAYAIYDQTGVDIEAAPSGKKPAHKSYGLRASGKVLKFSGWLEQYHAGRDLDEGPKSLAGEEDTGEAEAAQPTNGRSRSRRRRASSPSRSSRSRPPASTKARSCASSRNAASAAPAPTPRSSARCRRATT